MGLLDYAKQGAQNIWGEIQQLGDPEYMRQIKPMTNQEAMDIAMFALTTTGGNYSSILKNLAKENKSTAPKIPSGKVFKNEVGALDYPIRFNADDAFAKNNVNIESVLPENIIPTQRNVTTNNLKSVEGVTQMPDLIKVGDKYYISDGHHRIARDILNGKSSIDARVFNGLLGGK
jgi:hypothetical protein